MSVGLLKKTCIGKEPKNPGFPAGIAPKKVPPEKVLSRSFSKVRLKKDYYDIRKQQYLGGRRT